jgi:2'-5' RNA ligase
MDERPGTAKCGQFALVAYLPDPLSSCLDEIRTSLWANITSKPHITLLPPRPLNISVELASEEITKILTALPEFEVELSDVKLFSNTNTIYLDIGDGRSSLEHLHRKLNSGLFAYAEEFEFRPHITLIGPCKLDDVARQESSARSLWRGSDCDSRFNVSEIVFLWIEPGGAKGEWQQVRSFRLGGNDRPFGAAAAF